MLLEHYRYGVGGPMLFWNSLVGVASKTPHAGDPFLNQGAAVLVSLLHEGLLSEEYGS